MSVEIAKLLSLWMNSTFGVIQLLYNGAAIEGDWMKVHKYMLDNIYIPDPEIFIKDYNEDISSLYNEVSNVKVPSFIDQLRINHKIRNKIDKFFIERLNFDIWTEQKTINKYILLIQKELYEELKGLCPSQF